MACRRSDEHNSPTKLREKIKLVAFLTIFFKKRMFSTKYETIFDVISFVALNYG
jgi:hypothetical protein